MLIGHSEHTLCDSEVEATVQDTSSLKHVSRNNLIFGMAHFIRLDAIRTEKEHSIRIHLDKN